MWRILARKMARLKLLKSKYIIRFLLKGNSSVEIAEEEEDGVNNNEQAENLAEEEEEFAMVMEEEIQNLRKEIIYVYIDGFENQNQRNNNSDFSIFESESEEMSNFSDFETFSLISSHHD